jgi:hypothetical protein
VVIAVLGMLRGQCEQILVGDMRSPEGYLDHWSIVDEDPGAPVAVQALPPAPIESTI